MAQKGVQLINIVSVLCFLCSMDFHKGCSRVSAEGSPLNIQQSIQDREKDLQLLHREAEALRRSADETVAASEKIFTELIRLMENRSSDVRQQVRSQQRTEETRIKELQEKLQQEISELKLLSHTKDPHDSPPLPPLRESTSSFIVRPLRYFEDVTAAVSEVRDKLQDVLREKWTDVSLAVTEVDVLLSQPEPKTRAGFLRYSQEITLDPNTARSLLVLSDGNRKATLMGEQYYLSHPDRFTDYNQVLSRDSLTDRCYWEVEKTGEGGFFIAVAYKSISRDGDGDECGFGINDKSWVFDFEPIGYSFLYNTEQTLVSGPRSSRVGVYLDHRAGILSFYSISETMTLLHRVQTTFTQPLYAGLSMYLHGTTAEFCHLK
ncbi:Tripartite motif-containing protein 16 [Liparis tanakae]|uniref:Tripartite motif-containing protein 16 n=1 Tax=Liparis tanakae TaxID=230148 RepID=A0A4Z2JE79_9TELE|nr:Tripartite motif-containing protein 16 [Liparis tanakae]